ncbi:MAG: Hsp33 family molecular chaperone HslO [Burkholderiaceae bacterium]
MSDTLLKFLFKTAPVRGEIVNLADTWREMTEHHAYPPAVTRLLGEMVAAAPLLAATIKFNGALILQVHGDGPVKLMVVEVHPDMTIRATAKLRDDVSIAADASMTELINASGKGRCAITLDPKDRLPGQQPYQGVVSLEGESIAAVLEAYMRQSEQLDTRLWLTADNRAAAGMLLQKMPGTGGTSAEAADPDAWNRLQILAQTVKPEELSALSPAEVMRRLFWQEDPQASDPVTPRFACSCSRERIGNMLQSLGRAEVDSIIVELGAVHVTCDFCNRQYEFDAVDAEQLFAAGSTALPNTELRH